MVAELCFWFPKVLKEVILPLTGLEWLGGSAKGIRETIKVKVLLISSAL